ncbi:MAG: hypothetical protein IJ842_05490 [Bacilli bacterium]|nr:hypothetical protein [Bacilli bacterium]
MKSKPKYYVVDRTKKILSNKSLDELVETSKQMVKDIKNGIECSDTVRPFDLVDYYENTNLSINSFIKTVKEFITNDEYKTLVEFYKNNPDGSGKFDGKKIEDIIKNKIYVGVEFKTTKKLEHGKEVEHYEIVKNTGREFTEEEKIEAITYLVEHDLPLTYETYRAMRKRIINGYTKESNKVLKK